MPVIEGINFSAAGRSLTLTPALSGEGDYLVCRPKPATTQEHSGGPWRQLEKHQTMINF
ncbi:MAG: hypothetical protein H6556_31970 [Lewinellaceae bacterium]|nr:hypothetical protein [Lewinellaceae bacterium]